MGSIPVANPAPMRWRPPFLVVGLAAAVAVALVALVAVFAWPDGGPAGTVIGRVDDFEIGQPVHFDEYRVWIVRHDADRFSAFSDKDPDPAFAGQPCPVVWDPDLVVEGRLGLTRGWFRAACSGHDFDVTGQISGGNGPRGLNFFLAEAKSGRVGVSLDDPYCGAGTNIYRAPCYTPLAGAEGSTANSHPVIVPQED